MRAVAQYLVGGRTNSRGVDFLKRCFSSRFEIIFLRFKREHLHLDVVSNIIAGGSGVVFRQGWPKRNN